MTATPARRAALEVLRAVRRGELLDRAFARAAAAGRIPARDQRWTHELVYGTLRLRGRLDAVLGPRVRNGLDSLEPEVLDVLRLGAYQLLEMRSVPPYAAVSQAVELARRAGGRGADRLVNGVLQSLARDADAIGPPDFESDPVGYLTGWGSHPRWLVERWLSRYGPQGALRLVEANNRRPELYLTVLGIDVGAARARLAADGIEADVVPFAPGSLRLPSTASAARALALVPGVVQDPAARLVVLYAAVSPSMRVADLCAAPGGKALGIAERARSVLAADISAGRVRRLRENVERLGRQVPLPVETVVADALRPPVRRVDAVLLDVPCTGTGTFRRHPDGKWRIGPRDLEALVTLQAAMLDAAASIVRPGGLLIYSTCSLEPEENEDQVESFLKRAPAFERAPTEAPLDPGLLDDSGQLRVLPQDHGVDGAFAARLRRST